MPPMENYLKNFTNINQAHPDKSDYDRFYDHCKAFIKNNTLHAEKFHSSLVSCFDTIVNPYLISMIFKLLSLIDVKHYQIDFRIIEKYIKDTEISNSIFKYLISSKDRVPYKRYILEYLYNSDYESKNLFKILSLPEYGHELKVFLDNPNCCLYRKLRVILNTNFFYKIENYICHIGNEDRNICFLVYEIITLCIQSKSFIPGDIKNLIILKSNDDFTISFREKILVEDVSNFFFYFFGFMSNKQFILELLRKDNLEGIKHLLSNYLIKVDGFKIDKRIKNIKIFRKKAFSPEYKNQNALADESFDYLFKGGVCYKNMCDCIEI